MLTKSTTKWYSENVCKHYDCIIDSGYKLNLSCKLDGYIVPESSNNRFTYQLIYSHQYKHYISYKVTNKAWINQFNYKEIELNCFIEDKTLLSSWYNVYYFLNKARKLLRNNHIKFKKVLNAYVVCKHKDYSETLKILYI